MPSPFALAGSRSPLLLRLVFLALASSGGLLYSGCATRDAPFDAAAHRQEIEQWRADRIERLRQPDGWLTLAGLYWLDEGESTFGSDSSNDVVFPANAPGRIGSFIVEDGRVRMHVRPGADVWQDGRPVTSLDMEVDTTGTPTAVDLGSLSWYVIAREEGLGVRLKDAAHPNLAAFEGIETYDVDPSWHLEGRFERYDPPRTIPIPTILGTVRNEHSPGAVVFEVDGREYRLDVTGHADDEEYFVIFADETNGVDTYDAGRYLYVDAPDDDGRIVIDFNKAYNPPCVFTPYATCPFPPRQNRLPFAVTAGEKTYDKKASV